MFYVIEKNEGNGATGIYLSEGFTVSSNIYNAIKFFDKKSAESVFKKEKMTLKDWMITEHEFVD